MSYGQVKLEHESEDLYEEPNAVVSHDQGESDCHATDESLASSPPVMPVKNVGGNNSESYHSQKELGQ